MKDLKLSCDWHTPDFMTASKTETGRVVIDIDEDQQQCRVVFNEEKSAQLRDWLNEFLGEGKSSFTLHWIGVDEFLPKQTQSNRSVPVLVTINNRTVNTEACFDEGDFYLHGQLLSGVTHWALQPEPAGGISRD